MRTAIFVALAFCQASALSAGWLDRKAEGWAWYEDREEPSKEKIEKVEAESTPQTSSQRITQAREDLEERLATALLEPTPENLDAYMREQKRWLDQSGYFAKQWERYLLTHPDLDQRTQTPVSQYGIQIRKHQLHQEKVQLMEQLKESHGIFFFYKGSCVACRAFARVVQAFSERYGWGVLAISIDGKFLPEFPDSKVDNGISREFDVSVVPSLFVVNPKESVALPVAYGLLSLDQVEQNIVMQFKEEGEDV